MSAPLTPEQPPWVERFDQIINNPPPSRDAAPTEEVTPEEPQAPTEEEEPVATQPDDTPAEVEPEEVVADAEAAEEVELQAGEEGEPIDIKSTADLARAFGVEQAALHSKLTIPVGDEQVSVADLVERAQAAPIADQVAAAVAQERESLQTIGQHQVEEFDKHTAAFVGVINLLIDQVAGGPLSEKAINELKEEGDEQGFLVRSEERRQALGVIDRSIKQAQEYQQVYAKNQAPRQTMSDQEAAQTLLEAVPEWKENPQLALWDAKIIGESTASRYGYSAEEVNAHRDPRWCLMARDAHAYHRLVEQLRETKVTLDEKKLRARTTVIPTSARRPAENADAKRLSALRQRARETAGDPSKKRENEAALAELIGRHLPNQ